jgi:hypothetical protein
MELSIDFHCISLDINLVKKMFGIKAVDFSVLYVICFCIRLPISQKKTKPDFSCVKVEVIMY